MRGHRADSIHVTSDSSSEASEASSDSDTESSDVEADLTPADTYLRCLKKVAQTLKKTPEGREILTNLVAASPVADERASKRRLEEIITNLRKKSKKRKTQPERMWLCIVCDKDFTTKDDLKEHQGTCKRDEAPEVKKAFPCDKCDKSYVYKANLKRHVQSKHDNVATAGQTMSTSYNCALCKEVRVDIYVHYGTKHNIDNLEQVLFDNGRVLVRSDINTDDGKAPWFKEQLEKAKGRYNDTTCRLCEVNIGDTALLKTHYTENHKVDAASLDILKRLFRSEMNAHLGETSSPRRAEKKTDKKKVNTNDRSQNRDTTRIIYKCKCGKATDSYDAAVEHAQEHLVAKHTGKEMDDTRNFAFETNINDNSVIKVIDYDFETLLTDSWEDIFKDITSDKERILSSSLYLFYRSVKLHSEDRDSTVGVPAYKCDMCQLFVDPRKIKHHCENYKTCARGKPTGHYCQDCDAYFYSASALTHHKENHAAGFKLVMFNHKNDVQINKILAKLGNRSDDTQDEEDEEIEENTMRNENGQQIENQCVETYCNQCNKRMDASLMEAHAAEHQKEREKYLRSTIQSRNDSNDTEGLDVGNQSGIAARKETEPQPEDNNVGNRMQTEDEDPSNIVNSTTTRVIGNFPNDTENSDNVVGNESATRETDEPQGNGVGIMQTEDEDVIMDDVNENEGDAEDTVELWDSDDDSPGPYSIPVQTQADINTSVANVTDDQSAGSPKVVIQERFSDDSEPTSGDESLPCTQELERICRSANRNDCQEQTNATNIDKLPSTQELQQMLEDDNARNDNREEPDRQDASRDVFIEDTIQDENGESVEDNMADSEEREPNEPRDASVQENFCGNQAQRKSSRDILNELISDEEIDYFEYNAYIKSLLSSRDK